MKLSAKLFKFLFISLQELEESGSWQDLIQHDNRAPKRIHTGKAYLVLLGTMLDAGRRADVVQFEKILIRYIDQTLVHIPALETGRLWRVANNKLQFIHY